MIFVIHTLAIDASASASLVAISFRAVFARAHFSIRSHGGARDDGGSEGGIPADRVGSSSSDRSRVVATAATATSEGANIASCTRCNRRRSDGTLAITIFRTLFVAVVVDAAAIFDVLLR